MKSRKLKQFTAVIIAVSGVVSMVILTLAVANKHMTLGWYLLGVAVSTLVLQIDAWYLERQIINGKWKGGNA